jgi:hypothetical protein
MLDSGLVFQVKVLKIFQVAYNLVDYSLFVQKRFSNEYPETTPAASPFPATKVVTPTGVPRS